MIRKVWYGLGMVLLMANCLVGVVCGCLIIALCISYMVVGPTNF